MIYHSYYKKNLKETVKTQLSDLEESIFWLLYNGFGVEQKLQCSYFELLRVGDGKYTLTVQKYVNETYTIKFKVNKNYKNKANRFTN